MPTKQLENDILNEIGAWLQQQGYMFWRSNNVPVFGRNNGGEMRFRSLPRYTPKGLPDFMVIIDGYFLGLEVKRPKALVRPDQIIFGEKLKAHNAFYFIVHSLDEAKEAIDETQVQLLKRRLEIIAENT